MAKMTATRKRDPANPWDEFEEWDLGDVVRGIVLAVVDESGGGDVKETGDDGPLFQRADHSERRRAVPEQFRSETRKDTPHIYGVTSKGPEFDETRNILIKDHQITAFDMFAMKE